MIITDHTQKGGFGGVGGLEGEGGNGGAGGQVEIDIHGIR